MIFNVILNCFSDAMFESNVDEWKKHKTNESSRSSQETSDINHYFANSFKHDLSKPNFILFVNVHLPKNVLLIGSLNLI